MEQGGAGKGRDENKQRQPQNQPQPPPPQLVQRVAELMKACMEEGAAVRGGNENKQPHPQPQQPPPQLVQSLAGLIRPSPSTAVPSTSAATGGDSGVNQLLIGGGSGENHGQLLDKYVHDYMIKRGMYKTAEIYRQEAGVSNDPIEIDEPDGFLKEWWSIFYDIYASRQTKNQETK